MKGDAVKRRKSVLMRCRTANTHVKLHIHTYVGRMPHIRNEESCFVASGDLGCTRRKRANRQINAFVILDSSSPPSERSLLPFSCPSLASLLPSRSPLILSLSLSLTCVDLASVRRDKKMPEHYVILALVDEDEFYFEVSPGPLVNAPRL